MVIYLYNTNEFSASGGNNIQPRDPTLILLMCENLLVNKKEGANIKHQPYEPIKRS